MISAGIVLSRHVSLPFFGVQVNHDGLSLPFCIPKCLLGLCIIVSVDRTDIKEPQLLEKVGVIDQILKLLFDPSSETEERFAQKRHSQKHGGRVSLDAIIAF